MNSKVTNTKSGKDNCSDVLLIDNFGLSHYTSYLARGLAKHFKVKLLGLSDELFFLTKAKEQPNIEYCSMQSKILKQSNLLSFVIRPIYMFCILSNAIFNNDYRIIHIQGHMMMFYLFLPYLKFKKKIVCWTVHDIYLRPTSFGFKGKIELIYIHMLSMPELLSKFVDHVFVHGESLKHEISNRYKVPKKKITRIPHFDYEYLKEIDKIKSGNSVYNEPHENYILFFGRIAPYKGIEILIKSAKIAHSKAKNNNFKILIAGRGDIVRLRKQLNEEELGYISFRNEFVAYENLPLIFRNAKFVVLPYINASASGVLSLAYTFRKPVIVSNTGALAEFVEEGRTGYIFKQGDYYHLSELILKLFNNDQLCESMGLEAYNKVRTEMSLVHVVNKIRQTYELLTNSI